ncbi:hypothetical protein SDC9_159205 [bioreactor metagenome]|uniref:Uncharacterized protein n=1 Tax=bioreactor metagenome TaxID=1076179 RepID=A0A645FE77_9ZZZZ
MEPFTFQRGKPADEVAPFHNAFVLTDILAADAFLISTAKRAHHLLVWLTHCVPVAGCNGVADVRLTAEAVAAVFRLPVDGVSGNADGFLQNSNAALVLAGIGAGCVNGSGNLRFPASRMGIC